MRKALLLLVFLNLSCSSGPRFFINFSEPPDSSPGKSAAKGPAKPSPPSSASDREYWVLYQDWNISHHDLMRDLERPGLSNYALEVEIKGVMRAFEQVKEGLPDGDQATAQQFLSTYDELRKEAVGGGNFDILRRRLDTLGSQIRKLCHPDRLAALRSPPDEAHPAPQTAPEKPDE
ncbi:MAG: hypothetical protein HY717_15985, partial [Planctomycetes bacterium]|nr:hypothetical protein [Planctomycetota bacterium]